MRQRMRVRVTGVVQGVGFRPFVWRRATRLGLGGWVENDAGGVTVELEGAAGAIAAFLDGFAAAAPPLARVTAIERTDIPCAAAASPTFTILESGRHQATRSAVVPADVAPCDACLAELADSRDRRFGHPFISCTDCGPRFTIIESLPYDRGTTTMRDFPMCPACAAEYHAPNSRRFHAQPIACPDCGPVARFRPSSTTPGDAPHVQPTGGEAAIEAARAMLRAGGIVAIKGVGGFHLACDATNAAAVRVLRDRKRRPRKPLAVMVADADAAAAVAVVSDQERRLLAGPERPIVLLRRRHGPAAAAIPGDVAPGQGSLGVLLPSSPLHHRLCIGMPPLVMTSGNLAEEPIAIADDEAFARLGRLADGFLLHDRRILLPCDDSVVRCVAGMPLPLRRSRGHAPLPIRLGSEGPAVLAVGGELKAAVCVATGTEAVMGQHVGDMGNLETLEALHRSAEHLLSLLAVEPQAVVADLHPGYLSTDWARRFAADRGIPLVTVQHHAAHVASLLAEHGREPTAERGFIGVCFDGTGYGHDGSIHGGEFFLVDAGGMQRAGHLVPFLLPGGDAAIRQPWRSALAVAHAAGVTWRPPVAEVPSAEAEIVATQLRRGVGCASTTSMGRLFDAVAALAGGRHSIDYEAEAALDLEWLAASAPGHADQVHAWSLAAPGGGPVTADWRPVVIGILGDVAAGTSPATIAAAFHAAVVTMIVDTCRLLRDRGAGSTVGLTGGVFQNAVLVEGAIHALHAAGFEVLTHHAVPPNDGGLALGQAVLARAMLQLESRV